MLSFRFRSMYRNIGLSRPDAAKLLHVSERTLHNWETGHHEIPYSAYKLLRLLTRQELPGQAWDGWHITTGVLWSPEGHGFRPGDSSWWSLLCRRATLFHDLYTKNAELMVELAKSRASFSSHEPLPAPQDGDSKVTCYVTRHFSLTGETNQGETLAGVENKVRVPVTPHFSPKNWNLDAQDCPAEVRFVRSRLGHVLPKGGA